MTAVEPWWWGAASTVAAAIVGALIGAVPAFFLAKRSSREVLKRDAAARRAADKAIVQRILIKVLGLLDAHGDLKRHIDSQFAKEGSPGRTTFEPWQLVLPLTGNSPHDMPTFSPDELALLFSRGEYALMQKLMLFQRRCSSAYVSFEEYCERRTELEAKMPTPAAWNGVMATTFVTKQQQDALKQYTIPLNTLVLSLRHHVEEDWKMGNELASKLTTFARAELGQPNLKIELPEAAADETAGV